MSNLALCTIAVICIFVVLVAYRGSVIKHRERRIKLLEHKLSAAQREILEHKHRVAFWQRKAKELEAADGADDTNR